ncbi:transcriptional regulator [Amycolatopsis sp. NPDC101161]|uniref:transcriptional regulator n=1 Tax=Amycolatopsis sp. NPDC101161 TaxID=3363940 RepID=UPI0037FDD9B5
MALNDVISLSGSKLVAALVLVVLAVVFATSRVNGPAPLGSVRGVQRRQSFVPWVFGVVALGAWLISRYGTDVTHDLADAVGLPGYPDTVAGLDRLLSDPTRLAIMSVLCAAQWCDFAFLRDAVSLSDSALSKQLATLEKDGYVEQRRTYVGRVPKTSVQASSEGRQPFSGRCDSGGPRGRCRLGGGQWVSNPGRGGDPAPATRRS